MDKKSDSKQCDSDHKSRPTVESIPSTKETISSYEAKKLWYAYHIPCYVPPPPISFPEKLLRHSKTVKGKSLHKIKPKPTLAQQKTSKKCYCL